MESIYSLYSLWKTSMKIIVNTCYSHILYIMCSGELFSQAVNKMCITKGPMHKHEGMAGFIETEVVFEINNLEIFTRLWYSWYSLSDTKRLNLYGLAKGLGDCK